MSFLFTHAYYLSDDPKEQKIMKPYPPLGLLYVSAYLKSKNIDNAVFDTTFSSQKEQLNYILENQPKIICIYTNLMTKIEVVKLIKILKSDLYNHPKIVLGGPDVTYNVENYLKAGADFLVIGEGEETTFELYNAILSNGNFHQINGIAFLENNQIIQTTARTKFKDLDELPLPNREAINMYNYLETWKTNHGQSSMTISTQRGCPYTCKWCSTAVYGQSYRRRPAHLVAAEMKLLKEQYNPDAIWFVDDVFTISHKWLTAFHEEVVKQDAVIPFECITRAERLNEDILQLLKEAGCFRIWIGAESGSQTIIDAMDRRVGVNHVKKVIQDTNALGIETGTFIMLGYPGETEKDIAETIQYLKEANPTLYTITVAYPIKGTSLYNEIEHKITQQPDWETSTDRDIDFERTYSRKYYQYAVSKVVNEVEFHKNNFENKFESFEIKNQIDFGNRINENSQIMEGNILDYYAKTNTGFLHPAGKKATALLWDFLDCKKDERILELGFGTGASICLFATNHKETNFYGVEFNPIMFAKAKYRAALCKVENLTLFLSNDTQKLPFEDNFFDSIYVESVLAIQSDENLESLIKELSRVLKPDGKILINEGIWTDTTTAEEIAAINSICIDNFGIIQANAKYPHINNWKVLLENNGLKLKNLQVLNSKMNAKKISEPLKSKLFTLYGRLRSIVRLSYIIENYNYRQSMKKLNSGKQYLEGYLIYCIKEKTKNSL